MKTVTSKPAADSFCDARVRISVTVALDSTLHRHTTKPLEEFLGATASGELARPVALLSDDVVLYSDAGGKASAALNLIYGRDHVGRFLFDAIQETVPVDVITRMEEVNGHPVSFTVLQVCRVCYDF